MELNFSEEMIDPNDRDGRMSTGEGPSSGPGAGLEYDLWEGQFQFVGHSSQNERALSRRSPGSRLTEQVRITIAVVNNRMLNFDVVSADSVSIIQRNVC